MCETISLLSLKAFLKTLNISQRRKPRARRGHRLVTDASFGGKRHFPRRRSVGCTTHRTPPAGRATQWESCAHCSTPFCQSSGHSQSGSDPYPFCASARKCANKNFIRCETAMAPHWHPASTFALATVAKSDLTRQGRCPLCNDDSAGEGANVLQWRHKRHNDCRLLMALPMRLPPAPFR